MAVTKLTTDLNIVAGLEDLPNATSGLTAAQLKAKFDEAGNVIKTYVNDVLTPEIDAGFVTKTELSTTRKLSASGDFTGTLNGAPITATDPGLSSAFASHVADNATAHGINLKANKAQESQSQPTLVNGWASVNTVQYYKDEFGVVHPTGRINGGTTAEGTPLFTLNAGYRPPTTIFRNGVTYSTTTDAVPCVFQINTAGVVTLAFASKAVIIIDFSFRT